MQIYQVGGAVRDSLLGLHPRDVDYLVVGVTPAAMLAAGYTQVGADFPVFLHPDTKQEYALARTERKSGKGHKGFVVHADPGVTVEEDLARRDFTINAIARDSDGCLVDPHGGRGDLAQRVLRHVSPAFREDPLRVLRAARYASLLGLTVAPETSALIGEMVAAGDLEDLSAERVWQELSRGLMLKQAVAFITRLREFGALRQVLPEVDALFGVPQSAKHHPEGDAGWHTLLVLGVAASNWWPLDVRLGALLHDIGKAATPAAELPHHAGHEESGASLAHAACVRLRVPRRMLDAVVCATREHGVLHRFAGLDAAQRVAWFSKLSAWRSRVNLDCVLAVGDCDYAAHPSVSDFCLHPMRAEVDAALRAAQSADAAAAAQSAADDPATAVFTARVARLEFAMARPGVRG